MTSRAGIITIGLAYLAMLVGCVELVIQASPWCAGWFAVSFCFGFIGAELIDIDEKETKKWEDLNRLRSMGLR